ncbi:hypothetical protein HPB50_019072 [Hyalomma asiaticum]|uniref:Uncharacterized protein n=1 Tax=Hyalomma asiaticum TaxID=266040 RepID=A0ACB7TN80_HYAAI|nr:hypothetical protein HPB50_019072 [Hyalomma asiaticum]
MEFALADEEFVTAGDMTTEELATSVSKKETIADDSASDLEGQVEVTEGVVGNGDEGLLEAQPGSDDAPVSPPDTCTTP